jgi:hypothetical protein
MMVKQADALRAFYAADSGINMAVRELMTNTDADGDGTAGTISGDANAANDPAIATANVSVTRTINGTQFNLSSAGRNLSARRTISTTTDSLAGGARWMLYCNWPNGTPSVMQWNGRGWSQPGGTLDNGSMIYWALLKRCVPRVELLAATSNNAREITLMVFNGNTWGNLLKVTTDDGDRDHRPFYIAYERSSGDGLAVYRDRNNTDVYYRTWNGSAWSAQQTLTSPLTGHPMFMKLVPKPSSNEIVLGVLDDNGDLFASVWNGSAWTGTVALETSASSYDAESFDMAYETTSGRCVVVWGQAGNQQPQYRAWDGSSWSSTAAAPSVGAVPLWVRLTPNRADNRLALATLDDQSDVNVNIWSGSAWGADVEIAARASTIATRAVDIAWEPDGTRALCVYSNNNQSTPFYNIYDGSTWGTRQTGPDLTNTPLLLQTDASQNGKEILLSAVITGGQSALTFVRWDGTQWSNYTYLEGNVSGPTPKEVFMLSDSPPGAVGSSARVTGWSETAP